MIKAKSALLLGASTPAGANLASFISVGSSLPIQFIDASEFFEKRTNNNVLTSEHIKKIVEIFASKEEIAHVATSVDNDTIAQNDYNLAVSSYVEPKDTREKIDINELNLQIKETVAKISNLRSQIDDIIAQIELDGER